MNDLVPELKEYSQELMMKRLHSFTVTLKSLVECFARLSEKHFEM